MHPEQRVTPGSVGLWRGSGVLQVLSKSLLMELLLNACHSNSKLEGHDWTLYIVNILKT